MCIRDRIIDSGSAQIVPILIEGFVILLPKRPVNKTGLAKPAAADAAAEQLDNRPVMNRFQKRHHKVIREKDAVNILYHSFVHDRRSEMCIRDSDYSFLPADLNSGRVDQFHHAGWRAGQKIVIANHNFSHIYRMERIYIF